LGQYRRAIARCNQILRVEEHRESTYRQLMLYYYLAGDQGKALQAYKQCKEVLAEELDVEPSSLTQELYGQILKGEVPDIEEVYKPPPLVERRPLPYLLRHTPFVGREEEYTRLVNHLEEAKAGGGRAVFVSGEAGVGKTRLIQEFVGYAHQEYEARILQSRCYELEVKLPYQPIIGAIRDGLPHLRKGNMKMLVHRCRREQQADGGAPCSTSESIIINGVVGCWP
jgi:tetratricopeptide (TPR) repeat protein